MKTLRTEPRDGQPSPSTFAAKPVLSLFAASHLAIWHAVRLLGGYEAARLVDRCVGALERDNALSHRVQIMLAQILDILSLEDVHDPNQPYMGYFAAIDPSDPVVEEICLLTDALRDALDEAHRRYNWACQQKKFSQVA
ncbi:hypothetical protein [Salipiger sp.]|uniref:hypothetical protein n=1 Tax=Salipiger sp. TaxID=2078585 RepID=UPI003A973CAB